MFSAKACEPQFDLQNPHKKSDIYNPAELGGSASPANERSCLKQRKKQTNRTHGADKMAQ